MESLSCSVFLGRSHNLTELVFWKFGMHLLLKVVFRIEWHKVETPRLELARLP